MYREFIWASLMKLWLLFKVHRRLVAVVALVTFILFVAVGLLSPRVYESDASVYVHRGGLEAASQDKTPIMGGNVLTDHVKIIQSDLVMGKVVNALKKKLPKGPTLTKEQLAHRLRVVSAKNSKVIELSFQGNSPKYPATVLKEVIHGYGDTLHAMAESSKTQSRKSMKEHLTDIRRHKTALATKLSQLQADVGTIDTAKKNEEMLKISSSYRTRLGELDAEIIATRDEIAHLSKSLKLSEADIKGLSRVSEDSQIQHWKKQLGELKAQLNGLQARYTNSFSDVTEKIRERDALSSMIQKRIKILYGKVLTSHPESYSSVEQKLANRFLEQQAVLIGLEGQKGHYTALLNGLNGEFTSLAEKQQAIQAVEFDLKNLKSEEGKILNELQTDAINQSKLISMDKFSLLSPPRISNPDDYVFPLHMGQMLAAGVLASFVVGLFAVFLAEYTKPAVLDIATLPVLAEVKKLAGRGIPMNNLKRVYQSLALLLNRQTISSVGIFHICGAKPSERDPLKQLPFKECSYSPGVFAQQLATMFCERGVKVLLVDCSGTIMDEADAGSMKQQWGDYALYQYEGMDDLDILTPISGKNTFFDPILLKRVPNPEQYQLTLVNATLSDDVLDNHLIREAVDGLIFGISKTTTTPELLRQFQELANHKTTPVFGSILFP